MSPVYEADHGEDCEVSGASGYRFAFPTALPGKAGVDCPDCGKPLALRLAKEQAPYEQGWDGMGVAFVNTGVKGGDGDA